MAILIVIFDGAVPQFLPKDCLLHTVSVCSTGNTTIQDRLVFVSNEDEARGALCDPINAVGGAVPDGVRGIDGRKTAKFAMCSARTGLALVSVGIDDILLLIASDAGPQPVACLT